MNQFLSLMLCLGLLCSCERGSVPQTTLAQSAPCQVILLHGLARQASSMEMMAQSLRQEGFAVQNLSYASTKYPIETLAVQVGSKIHRLIPDSVPLCFVTHSMGGILLREMRAQALIPSPWRAVMLGPPNQGSFIPDEMASTWYFRWWNGPAGMQLRTGSNGLPYYLGPVDFELGIIAGNRVPWWDSHWQKFIHVPNDGKVTVSQTHVQGEKSHLVLPVAHTTMSEDPTVIHQTIYFLRNGRFESLRKNSD